MKDQRNQSTRTSCCMQSDTVEKSRRTRRSSRPRTEYAFDVNTNETRCECRKRQAHRKSCRESKLTARNILREKSSRTSLHESKASVARNHEGVQGYELRGKERNPGVEHGSHRGDAARERDLSGGTGRVQ